MDGWWTEDETFFPLEDSPDDEEQLLPVETNPFKPISVADRFDQMDTRSFPAAPVDATAAPGQPTEPPAARLAPLAPARSFPPAPQQSPFAYDLPSGPEAMPPFGMNTGTLPPVGQPTGGMDLSALHQTTQTGPVPIWSIDHAPVQPVPMGGASAPYPGFPPLPQNKPAADEPGSLTDHHGVNWTLPDYPEPDPDWQPTEGAAAEVPEFLKEAKPAPDSGETKPPEKLNIPAYLRVQPLPKKKPRPAPPPQEEAPAAQPAADSPAAMPFRGDEADGKPQEEWVGNEAYMRPKQEEEPATPTEENFEQLSMEQFLLGAASQTPKAEPDEGVVSQPAEPSPEEEIVSAADVPAEAAAAVAVTSGNRRSRRSRMAAREPAAPEGQPTEEQPSQPEAAEVVSPAQDQPAAEAQPRRRRHRSEAAQEAAQPAPTEEDRPFVPAVGAEDSTADTSAARPAQDEPTQPEETPDQPADETPPQAMPFTSAPPLRSGLSSAGQLLPFVRRSPEGTVFAPVAEIDSDDDWHPYSEAPTVFKPLFSATDSPFGPPQTPIPDAPEQGWSPFDGQADAAEEPVVSEKDSASAVDAPAEEWSLFDGPKDSPAQDAADHADEAQPADFADTPLFPASAATTDSPLDSDSAEDAPLFPEPLPEDKPAQEWSLFDKPDAGSAQEAGDMQAADDDMTGTADDTPTADATPDHGDTLANSEAAEPAETPEPTNTSDTTGAPDAPDTPADSIPDPFTARQTTETSLFPEDSAALFGHGLPPIPDAPQQEWLPYGTTEPGNSLSFEEGFPPPVLFNDDLAINADDDLMLPPGGPEEPLLSAFGQEEAPAFQQEAPFMPSFQQDNELFVDVSPYPEDSYENSLLSAAAQGGLPYQRINNLDAKIRALGPSSDLPDAPTGEPPTQQWASAHPRKQASPQPAPKQRPPINPVRLLLLILAVAMAVFCIIAGCKMLMGYVQNTEDWSRTHAQFYSENGISMNQAGELVSLPEDGSTFAPTSAPVLAAAQPIADGQHDTSDAAAQPTPTPVLRTKLRQYPDNPLRNPIKLITDMRKDYPEVVGKLEIPGVVEEWIVQRNNTYYLNHNYRGTSAEGGAVFMDAACTLDTPPENLHLRGRGGVPGKTFNALWQYKTGGMSFIYNAEVAHVTTLYEEQRYILFAIIETSGDPAKADYFNYASHPTFATDEEMMDYVARAREHSLYNLPTEVSPGDRLLTLSTVSSADDATNQDTNLVLFFSAKP